MSGSALAGALGRLSPQAGRVVDTVLDRTVAPGYSALGYKVRRSLASWPADPAPDALAGRDVVVTGASSGLGVATAEQLARLGARVHLVVRDTAKGGGVRDDIERSVPGADLRVWRCDVSDLDDVRRFAGELAAEVDHLHAIVHNAGAMPPERTESAQGHEMTMALHVLGPLVMTDALLDRLAGDGRVVMVTSGGMYTQRLPVDDPDYRRGGYHPPTAYARSKRVQVALLPDLQRRWGGAGVSVYATHPGWADTPGVVDSLPGFHKITGPILRDADEGADTSVWLCAVDPAPEGGSLWHDRRARPAHYSRRTHDTAPERLAMLGWVLDAAGLPAEPGSGASAGDGDR